MSDLLHKKPENYSPCQKQATIQQLEWSSNPRLETAQEHEIVRPVIYVYGWIGR